MELLCPAGNLPSLKAAVDHGANAVYVGFKDATNARHFAGLNFTIDELRRGIEYTHDAGSKVLVAINTYPVESGWSDWQCAVDTAAELGVDSLIVADIGVMDYACSCWPRLPLHLSVQGSATNEDAIMFFHDHFNIQRAVLPRVLSVRQVANIVRNVDIPIEVFGFGSLCIMVEGRCQLSSYLTGCSPNTYGACSPAAYVRWEDRDDRLEVRVNGMLIDRFEPDEPAGYPTICKGRFRVAKQTYYALEEPTSLSVLNILPELYRAGVAAIKVEGRQRSATYVAQVTAIMRAAIDACVADPEQYQPQQEWQAGLARLSEGSQTTLGAYHRPWS